MAPPRRIPFVLAPYPEPDHQTPVIEDRLIAAWRRCRGRTEGIEPPRRLDGSIARQDWDRSVRHIQVPRDGFRRIEDRARRLAARYAARTSLSALSKEDLRRLEAVRDGVFVRAVVSLDQADELAAALHAEFPWMAEATSIVWCALRRSTEQDEPGFRLPPILLDGPPGIGKSSWARRLAELFGVAGLHIDASGENASFAIAGLQKGWSRSMIGRPLELILRTEGANPLIVVDEIDKAGTATSDKGTTFSLTDALLPFLERSSAARWDCPAMRVPFDMSWIGWVLTSNDASVLPEPLVSRCSVVRLGNLTKEELLDVAAREGHRQGLTDISIEAVQEALSAAVDAGSTPSLRTVTRLIELAIDLQSRPRRH